jgi:hypothetical protein
VVNLQSAVLGAVVFLVVVALLYWLATKLTSLGTDERDSDSTTDRMEMDGAERHHRVGFRGRVSRQTPTMKAFLLAIILLLGYFAVATYQIAQTGTPSEAPYSGVIQLGVAFLLCIIAGIWFKSKQDAKAGELQIMKEQDEGNTRRTVSFDRRMARPTENGTTLVPELKENQFLGLFWRPLLVADDPELRDADHRLPDDLVLYEVPNDESAVWNTRTDEVTVRAKNIRTVDNPDRSADYEIVPSDRKSKSEIQQLENENAELEEELRSEKVQNGLLSEKLTEIENILTNEEQSSLKRYEEAKEALEDDRPVPRRPAGNQQNGTEQRQPAQTTD